MAAKKKSDRIGFALVDIVTEQFATIYKPASDEGDVGVEVQVSANYSSRMVRIKTNMQFFEGDKVFMQIEVSGHFEIAPDSWDMLSLHETKDVVLNKDFILHLVGIVISTARGVLHAKTEGTLFNEYLLPVMDLKRMIEKDVVINKDDIIAN